MHLITNQLFITPKFILQIKINTMKGDRKEKGKII